MSLACDWRMLLTYAIACALDGRALYEVKAMPWRFFKSFPLCVCHDLCFGCELYAHHFDGKHDLMFVCRMWQPLQPFMSLVTMAAYCSLLTTRSALQQLSKVINLICINCDLDLRSVLL